MLLTLDRILLEDLGKGIEGTSDFGLVHGFHEHEWSLSNYGT